MCTRLEYRARYQQLARVSRRVGASLPGEHGLQYYYAAAVERFCWRTMRGQVPGCYQYHCRCQVAGACLVHCLVYYLACSALYPFLSFPILLSALSVPIYCYPLLLLLRLPCFHALSVNTLRPLRLL